MYVERIVEEELKPRLEKLGKYINYNFNVDSPLELLLSTYRNLKDAELKEDFKTLALFFELEIPNILRKCGRFQILKDEETQRKFKTYLIKERRISAWINFRNYLRESSEF